MLRGYNSLTIYSSTKERSAVQAINAAIDQSSNVDANKRKLPVKRSLLTPKRLLKKSDFEDKFLVTRTTGRLYGKLGDAWVDPRRLWVKDFDVMDKTNPLVYRITGNVKLESIKEVGDVVLIEQDGDMSPSLQLERYSMRQSLTTLAGLKVVLDSGEVLGRIVDFSFDPETGRILHLVYHSANFSLSPNFPIPIAATLDFFDRHLIDVRDISKIVLSQRTIYIKTASERRQIGSGKFQFLANLLPVIGIKEKEINWDEGMSVMEEYGISDSLQNEYKKILEESRKQQQAYYATYGDVSGIQNEKQSNRQRQNQKQMIKRNYPSSMKRGSNKAALSDKSSAMKEKKIGDWLESEPMPNYQKQYENEEYL